MSTPFKTSRRVEFCETDAAGLVHFSAFFQYMEQAEHALLRHCGLSVMLEDSGGRLISWPRVNAECDFSGAARFEDVLEVNATISRLGDRSVIYSFEFDLADQRIAKGAITTVCCQIKHNEAPRSIMIPDWIREKLKPYVA